jgi:hypothetical protein
VDGVPTTRLINRIRIPQAEARGSCQRQDRRRRQPLHPARSCQSDVSDHARARRGTSRVVTTGNPVAAGVSRHHATSGDSRYEPLTALAGRRTSPDGYERDLRFPEVWGSGRCPRL